MQDRYTQPPYQWYAKRVSDGNKVAVGHEEYVFRGFGSSANISNYVDHTSAPEGHKAKEWLGLIASKRQIIIRPRIGTSMKSFSEEHWGTLYEVRNLFMDETTVRLELHSPIKLKPAEAE